MNRHKQNYSNIGNSHTLNQHFESSGVAVLSSYYMYRILARPPILGICRLVCGNKHRDISFYADTPPFTLRYGILRSSSSWSHGVSDLPVSEYKRSGYRSYL